MAHPSDAALRLKLEPALLDLHRRKVEELINKPTERAAGYIQAVRDVLAIMNGDQLPTIDHPTHPGASSGG